MEPYYKTFVSIGNCNQHFSRLLTAVDQYASLLPQPIFVQCGHTPFSSAQCEWRDFIEMDAFLRYVKNAELLIFHGGAGSVLHAIRAGKCPIVMPRLARFGEHINDHQVTFATTLQTEGKVCVIQEADALAEAVQKVKKIEALPHALPSQSKAFNIIQNRLISLFDKRT